MTTHNAKFWRGRFRQDYIPATKRVVEVFLSRLMPTFSTAEAEAEAYTNKLWEDANSQLVDPYGPDQSEIAELVQKAGVGHYLGLKSMEQGVLNCCALFIYHLFEQHLMVFHRQELLTPREQGEVSLMTHTEVHKRLKGSGIDLRSFASWGKLEELRYLANTLKHGEGSSRKELAKLAPDLFKPPVLKGSETYAQMGSRPVYTPLIGQEVFVTVTHIHEYAGAVEAFWNELSDALNGI